VSAEERHDLVMVGRLNQNRNLDVVLDAWQRHVDGGGWRGDELVLIDGRRGNDRQTVPPTAASTAT
jgi:hypothetical protein